MCMGVYMVIPIISKWCCLLPGTCRLHGEACPNNLGTKQICDPDIFYLGACCTAQWLPGARMDVHVWASGLTALNLIHTTALLTN